MDNVTIAMFSIFRWQRHHRRCPGSRGYVAVSGDDQQHHAAIRGKRKCARAVKDQIDAGFISKPASPCWCFASIVSPGNSRHHLTERSAAVISSSAGGAAAGDKLDPTPIARTHGLNPGNLNKYDARIAAGSIIPA